MKVSELKKAVESGSFDAAFSKLYPSVDAARQRYCGICDGYIQTFGDAPDARFFSAPGRTEVGGNHTDHQHGRVLAGSVDLDVIACVCQNNSKVVKIQSEGYDMTHVSLSSLESDRDEFGSTAALAKGCLASFADLGCQLTGFDAYCTSNVLRGSGLSSSAAFEVLICNILNGLFYEKRATRVEIAKISQRAEREFFGKPCGLLDQMASSQGGFTAIDFKNPEIPVVEQIEFDIQKHGYVLCVVDTHGDHADLTQDYADITVECRAVSNFFGKDFLRDVSEKEFYRQLPQLRSACGDRAVLRAFHFFNEDRRAEEEKQALKQDDFEHFLDLVNESGDSSYKYLQNLYSVSAVENQGLCLAIALTERFLSGEGACRVHGGGFAGTIQCYIPADRIDEYRTMIDSVFGKGSCCVLTIRPIGGTEVTADL